MRDVGLSGEPPEIVSEAMMHRGGGNQNAAEVNATRKAGRHWAGTLILVVLPFLLVAGGYYRPMLLGSREWPISGDACFYTYQLSRIGELSGQWWKLGQDELVGAPYQPEFGKHPGVYEGVDLLMVSTLTSRWLDPVVNYHLMMMVVLIVNGWVVGWLVRRLTGSWAWAVLGVILVSWNYSTAFRLQGHAHLFKYGWTVLAVTAFSRYLDQPTRRRGLLLGLAMALVLQGSFYLGSFLAMACGLWWLGCLAAGRLGRHHALPTAVSIVSFALLALIFTFPVWACNRSKLLADSYGGHGRIDAWENSAELWQYFLSPASSTAASYVNEFGTRFHTDRTMLEGWHYPGWTVLLALGAYLVVRLRGRSLPVGDVRLLDRFMGISGLLVLLSLAGGPSFFLVSGIGCFRAYGRAGLLALALWCIVAPVILHGLSQSFQSDRRRRLALLGMLSLSLFEGYQATTWFPIERRMEIPDWVDWLATQPSDVRLAAFSPARDREVDWWGYEPLFFKSRHHHASLNGSDSLLFAADLKLLGATYEKMNPAGLRYIVSLGYDNLAFHRDYLEANPWIRSSPWLDRLDTRGPWVFYRAKHQIGRLPRASLEAIIASWPESNSLIEVPAESWITGRFELPGDVVAGESRPVWLVWTDQDGQRIGEPARALYQHVFGPGIPAFCVKTPQLDGDYRLVILDDERRPIHSRGYRVRRSLETILTRSTSTKDVDAGELVTATVISNGSTPTLILENKSPYYLQANTSRDQVYLKSARCHAGTLRTSAGSLVLQLAPAPRLAGRWYDQSLVLLPCDLAPQGRLELNLPCIVDSASERVDAPQIKPYFLRPGEQVGSQPGSAVEIVQRKAASRRLEAARHRLE